MEATNFSQTLPQQYADVAKEQPPQPLTADVMSAMNDLGSRAEEIVSRLYGLKDRLFGMVPTTGVAGANAANIPSANNFADAFTNRAADLRRLLITIDHLSGEIAGRL